MEKDGTVKYKKNLKNGNRYIIIWLHKQQFGGQNKLIAKDFRRKFISVSESGFFLTS